MLFSRKRSAVIDSSDALAGRDEPLATASTHAVLGTSLHPPVPDGTATAVFAMGCFWGAERLYWQTPGVITTAAGYSGGTTPNPTYGEVCSERTGHAEAVLMAYDPETVTYEALLKVFWENHDPTQAMRQGNDVGTQYRSAIFVADDAQRAEAQRSVEVYQQRLTAAGYGTIHTEISPAGPFYYAEEYHQQYLAKNPSGYCNHGFCQVGYEVAPAAARSDTATS